MKLPFQLKNTDEFIRDIENIGRFRPKQSTILFVLEGAIIFDVNFQEQKFQAGDIVFMVSKSIYKYLKIEGGTNLYLLDFNLDAYRKIRAGFNRFEIYRALYFKQLHCLHLSNIELKNTLSPLLNMLYYQSKKATDLGASNEVAIHLFKTLIQVVSEEFSRLESVHENQNNTRRNKLVFSFLELATNNCIEEKELRYYANKLNVSIKYLSICVKEEIGFSPSYILDQLLLREARIKLVDENDTITNIADYLGFSDLHSFSKFFKKNSGVSPYAFRKEISK